MAYTTARIAIQKIQVFCDMYPYEGSSHHPSILDTIHTSSAPLELKVGVLNQILRMLRIEKEIDKDNQQYKA